MEPVTEKLLVPCLNNLLAVSITRPAGQPELRPTILILHGSGASNQTRSLYVAKHFAKLGLATLRFDQSGHGKSTGHIRNSSLNQKQAEASAMLAYMQQPISIIGSSMGAQTATMMTRDFAVENLVFIAPAMYGAPCHTVNFGPDFSFFIKLPGFWRDSPAWPLLREYKNNFLLVSAGREERVNPEVAQLCWSESVNAKRRQHLLFPESDHSIQLWLDKHPAEQKRFLDILTSFIAPASMEPQNA